MAFVLGFITIAFVPEGVPVFGNRWLPIVLASVLSAAACVTLYFIGQGYSETQKKAISRVAASSVLDGFISIGQLTPSDRTSLDNTARDLLRMTLDTTESTRSLFERMARAVNKDIPSSFNYSPVESRPLD